ncbi:MAG: MBL fold metallo-hydrolase [Nanoarchaeota archaeon]|nr:MBL fold metallo-hydrolase [Nanoarchaeota archaeon]
MTSITLYGGVNEIGGNKILLEDKGVKLFFDFGQSFSFGNDYCYGYLQPRSRIGLLDYFEFNMLPKIKGIYSSEELSACSGFPYTSPKIHGVFISHCHSDHINHIKFLDPKIPIHVGHGTKTIMDISEVTSAFADYGEEHNYRLFKSGDKVKVKHIVVEPIHVDHSIPGAYGFIIHTSKGNIIYTGDLRLHGPKGDMTKEFIKRAKEANPVAMLSEGTRVTEHDPEASNTSEALVESEAKKIISNAEHMVLADTAIRNIDRLMAFYNAAVKNDKFFVIDTKMAYTLDMLKDKIDLPNVIKGKHIKVYFRQMKSCTYIEKDYPLWERPYMQNMVNAKWVHRNQDDVVMAFNIYKLFELVSIRPKKNSDYIYSMSEHFLEGPDNAEALGVRKNWMEHFKFKMPEKNYAEIDNKDGTKEPVPIHKLHASGHMPKEDVMNMIRTINPDMVIPIHTQNPKSFGQFHKRVVLPEIEKEIKIR